MIISNNEDLIIYMIISFLVFTIILCMNSEKRENFGNYGKGELINILTRTGNREKCYKNLIDSLNKQTYKNFRHIKSNDNKSCSFLKNEKDLINFDKVKKYNHHHCPYNSYLNKLIDNVNEGWIIILDDDAKFIDEKYLENLSNELKNCKKEEVLVTNIYNSNKKEMIPNLNPSNSSEGHLRNIQYGSLDMGCLIFHHTNKTRFREACGGDINFYKEGIDTYKPKFINIKPGIWVNYSGKSDGKHSTCD